MTHNEKRQHWLKEGAIGLGTGVLYGITSVAVGACRVCVACTCVEWAGGPLWGPSLV